MLGPVAWRTPPEHYGPWELVTGLLTEGLVAHGVDVTLFATLDSLTNAFDGVCPHGYAEDPTMDGRVWEALAERRRRRGRAHDRLRDSLPCLRTCSSCVSDCNGVATLLGRSARIASRAIADARPAVMANVRL